MISQKIRTSSFLGFLAKMWNIKLSIRSCDICKDFRLEIYDINCRYQYSSAVIDRLEIPPSPVTLMNIPFKAWRSAAEVPTRNELYASV